MDLTSRRPLVAVIAAAATFAVAGCGDDEETDTAAQNTATEETQTDGAAAAGESSTTVSATEFEFDPSDPTIEEDGQVEIEMTNDGEVQHAVAIDETGDSSDTVEGGQTATLRTNLDSGKYTIFCPVGNHRQLGMEGTLTVGAGGGGGGGDDGEDDDSASGSSDDDSGSSGGGY